MKLRLRITAILNSLLIIATFTVITSTKRVEAQTTALDCLKEAAKYFDSALFGSSNASEKAADLAAELCREYQTPETLTCAKEAEKVFDNALFGSLSSEQRKERSLTLAVELCKIAGTKQSVTCAKEAQKFLDNTFLGILTDEEKSERSTTLAIDLCRIGGTTQAVTCMKKAYPGFDEVLADAELSDNERRMQAVERAVEFCRQGDW
ncbi:hypothetical protein ACE1B6_15480 [Aerosakkonemataceae cyanobacterium BLCC-F154]|uniref:Secreted protein n=1 Tax=Floridaenema fluviatile BLCC-F154 TaxID=3153640 RepID=A0ABV4YCV4_9CYAN